MISITSVANIPGSGVDEAISCGNCPSACCRKGMVMSLSDSEAAYLQDGGTSLEKMNKKSSIMARVLHLGSGKDSYMLKSDCSNLEIDSETNETSCIVFSEPERPEVCDNYKMGAYQCGRLQLARVASGQDEFADKIV